MASNPAATPAPESADGGAGPARPLLSVIVPVYNQGPEIAGNVEAIREQITPRIDGELELIVVSDGSSDLNEEELTAHHHNLRVIHYDRNLGKGYAVRIGTLAARGEWLSYIDADLDLDPASIPQYLEVARLERLDFAIGSKRHPDSVVIYPRSRRTASWLYQQLVRFLFRLDVSDTQAGLKVFRREVADEVMPLLLVKRYAFDLELLAVARAFGFGRVRELPVTLNYRFTGSGVRSRAVAQALIDTLAIFYRLRILRYYQRKRALLGTVRRTDASKFAPYVSLVVFEGPLRRELDYDDVDIMVESTDTPTVRRRAAENARSDIIAFVAPGAEPAGNWLSVTVPFFQIRDVSAVVCPTMAPDVGSSRELAAAAISESRLGGGSLYFRFTPGNLRFVDDFPGSSFVVRRHDYLDLSEDEFYYGVAAGLSRRGKRCLYTPETLIVAGRPPLFRAHLTSVAAHASRRGALVARNGWRALRPTTLGLPLIVGAVAAGWPLLLAGEPWATIWIAIAALYGAALAASVLLAAVRFGSFRVGGLTAVGMVATHATYTRYLVRTILQEELLKRRGGRRIPADASRGRGS
jgi:glycosyltransferase involved in cell wall biosynthesis